MLNRETVKIMAELFFSGEPEKAYAMFHTANEWDQFVNSIKKKDNQDRMYRIMCQSDMDLWRSNYNIEGASRPDTTYDIGY